MIVAAVGDVHGHMHAMVRLLQAWERRSGRAIDLVLQVGDLKNFHYLGRVGVVERGGLRIAGLSAIYRAEQLTAVRPGPEEFGRRSNKEFIGFMESEVEAMLALGGVDVLLLHDWPAGLVRAEEISAMRARAARLGYEEIGNEYARLVVEALRPRLVLCGHMHTRHRATIGLTDGGEARVRCLSEVAAGTDALAVFAVEDGEIRELDERGMAV